jgi:hypothetical protein
MKFVYKSVQVVWTAGVLQSQGRSNELQSCELLGGRKYSRLAMLFSGDVMIGTRTRWYGDF